MASSSTNAAQVVTGSAATGFRRTVIDTTPGAVLPAWIIALEIPIDAAGTTLTTYADNGLPGGSYQPAGSSATGGGVQLLPDLVSNVTPASPWLAVLAIAAGLWWLLTHNERGAQWQ